MPTDPTKIVMEKSPNYAFSNSTPKRLEAFNPDTKLIMLIRNPVKRIMSEYTQVKKLDIYQKSPNMSMLFFLFSKS